MKHIIQLSLLSGVLLSNAGFALNPVGGFYGGLMAEASNGPSRDTIQIHENPHHYKGIVHYSSLGGGGGFMLGYKFRQFRTEGQFLYNHISTGPVDIGDCRIENADILTPTGSCPAKAVANGIGHNGKSTAMYGLVNAYWDFFSYEGETSLVPYLGLGFGMAQVKNTNEFVATRTYYTHEQNKTNSSAAYQGIVGLSYYMDDFAWIGMDYRYLSTKNLPIFENKKYALNTLNFVVNFAFDKGAL